MNGGLKLSGMRRGEWIVSNSDVWLEEIPLPVRYPRDLESDPRSPQHRPYYLRKLALFGRVLMVWIPDYAMTSDEAMNRWAIDQILNSHVANAMNTYATRTIENPADGVAS